MRARLCRTFKNQGRISPTLWHCKRNRMSIYCVIYLSVAGFTINIFFIAFYKKCIIIGSSAFHNYDSYTVEMTKAASAKRSVHVDRQPVLNTQRHNSKLYKTDTGLVYQARPAHISHLRKYLLSTSVRLVPLYMYTSHPDNIIGSSVFHNVQKEGSFCLPMCVSVSEAVPSIFHCRGGCFYYREQCFP